jgi:mannose/fructose/N-acetylgalactosamine-specific phosphotransferase system component IIC
MMIMKKMMVVGLMKLKMMMKMEVFNWLLIGFLHSMFNLHPKPRRMVQISSNIVAQPFAHCGWRWRSASPKRTR